MPELAEMASMYGDAIRKHQPQGPYFLAGVSFGGLLAFELARQFRLAGEDVLFVGVFDTILPQTIGKLRRLSAHAMMAMSEGPTYLVSKLAHAVARRSRIAARILAKSQVRQSAGDAEAKALADMRGQMYDHALERYRRDMPKYDGDLHFYRARERDKFESVAFPPDCNWGRYVNGRCCVHEVAGGHISMLACSNVSELAALVREALERGCTR